MTRRYCRWARAIAREGALGRRDRPRQCRFTLGSSRDSFTSAPSGSFAYYICRGWPRAPTRKRFHDSFLPGDRPPRVGPSGRGRGPRARHPFHAACAAVRRWASARGKLHLSGSLGDRLLGFCRREISTKVRALTPSALLFYGGIITCCGQLVALASFKAPLLRIMTWQFALSLIVALDKGRRSAGQLHIRAMNSSVADRPNPASPFFLISRNRDFQSAYYLVTHGWRKIL